MFRRTLPWLAVFALVLFASVARAEPFKPAPSSVQVMFLPPPLEAGAVYSVGVYETATGRLVRRLHENVEDGAFTAGLNGFITFWDRKDDAGKTVPAGRYAARGWAVGEMRVEGETILGNEWASQDETFRVKRIVDLSVVEAERGFLLAVETTGGLAELMRFRDDGTLQWRHPLALSVDPSDRLSHYAEEENARYEGASVEVEFAIEDGHEARRWTVEPDPNYRNPLWRREGGGVGNTVWLARSGGLYQLELEEFYKLAQNSAERVLRLTGDDLKHLAIRVLALEPDQPAPRLVRGSQSSNRLYLVEEVDNWQRVRGLEWSDTKPDASGRPVSEWRTFFERSIRRPDPALGLDENAPSPVVELPLAKNPLEPGKPQRARLRAGFDAHGSFLETADGLRLLPVSTRPNLHAAHLKRDPKDADRLLFYQFDGAAWDVFSVTGVPKALVGFDAGEFELTADGERHPQPPTEEPRDP